MSKGVAGLSPLPGLAAAAIETQALDLGQKVDCPRHGLSLPPRWLEWGREIQALSQTGLHYAENEYQRERYTRLIEIAAEIVDENCGAGDPPSARLPGMDYSSLLEAFRAQTGYATLRVDVRFFGIQELPEHLSGERTRPRQIQDAYAVLNDVHIPTVFD